MTQLCEGVARDHQVRKGDRRKRAFREYVKVELRRRGIFLREERAKGLIFNANLVAGNVETAEIIVGAHYDTCAELPFPNLAAPLNWPLTLMFQLLVYAELLAVSALPAAVAALLGAPAAVAAPLSVAAFLGLTVLLVGGPANPRTMNDNTSGVAAALTLLERMTPSQRRRVAVVLFDNEELGLIGSALFRRRHKNAADKPMINLDCVGDGGHFLFAAGKALRRDEALYARVREAFPDRGGIKALHVPAWRALYPSDQFGFRKSLAAAALNRRRGLGYVLGRIHTRRDTVLDEKNIEYLVEGLLQLIGHEDK